MTERTAVPKATIGAVDSYTRIRGKADSDGSVSYRCARLGPN